MTGDSQYFSSACHQIGDKRQMTFVHTHSVRLHGVLDFLNNTGPVEKEPQSNVFTIGHEDIYSLPGSFDSKNILDLYYIVSAAPNRTYASGRQNTPEVFPLR